MQQKSTSRATSTPATINKYVRSYVDPEVVQHNRNILAVVGCVRNQRDMFSTRTYEALPRWVKRRIKRLRRTNRQQEWATLQAGPGQKAFYMDKSFLPRGPEKAKGARA